MTYDHQVTLISETYSENDIGEMVPAETKTKILCREQSVGRSEFYTAAAAGHRPEVVLVVHRYEYNGERKVDYKNTRYNVIRAYAVNTEEIELVCEAPAHGRS